VPGRRGLRSEVLLSLALLMGTSILVLGSVLLATHESHVRQLHGLAARSLLADARAPFPMLHESVPGIRWWSLDAQEHVTPRSEAAGPIDAGSRALAKEARSEGRPVLRAGRPWQAIRFAAPVGEREIAVAWLPPVASPVVLAAVLFAALCVFTGFGAYVLRGSLVAPLEQLAAAVRAMGTGDLAVRAPVAGTRETAEVAEAVNAMTEALARRSEALEKAVAELRESNQSLREARSGLERAERLAAVGSLAAGVAHEVGNPMGAVLAFIDLASRTPGLDARAREHLARAQREGERVRAILRQLLDFASPPRAARVPVELARICEETAALVRAQRRYAAVRIEVRCEGEPPPALADPAGVAQILLNLLLNAADALSGRAQPEIRMTVRAAAGRVRAGDPDRAAALARRQGDAVECLIEDNGPGVAAEHRERIFDPFFTSKPPGEGTGLGLANALRIAHELGGGLELLPERPQGGAAFLLRLPAPRESSRSDTREGR
jgi:C4-dicarboxylate-specific signal transduction histidine kinase